MSFNWVTVGLKPVFDRKFLKNTFFTPWKPIIVDRNDDLSIHFYKNIIAIILSDIFGTIVNQTGIFLI